MVIFGGKLSDAKKRAPNQVPLFLEKSLVYVEQNLVDCEGIFRVSGSLENIKRIKEAIERGGGDVDYDKTPVRDTHEVAGIVKLYFRELSEPLVPTSLMKDFVKVGANENNSLNEPSVIALLSRLPPDNYATMKRLMLFLKKLSEFSATTKMTADNLALVFSPNLLRDASSGYQEMMWSGHISSIVCFMISRANSLFPDSSTLVPPPKLQTPAVPPPIKRPPSVTTRKTLSAVDLSSYTLKGEFRVGMAHNLPNPPACLQGCNWGPLTQTGKVSVHASNESSSVIILIVGDEGRPIAQGIPANVMDTSDSSRYFVIPKTSNAIIVPGQEVGIGYIGVALYTPEDSMTFRGLVDVYRPQEFITHKPNQNGTFVLNTQQQQQQQQQTQQNTGHPRTLTNAAPMRPPFRKPVPAASVERYISGTTYRKIINMSLDDEELIVYERVVQLSYANVFRCSIGPLCCMVKIFAKPDDKIIQYTLQEHANKIKHPNLLRSLGSQYEENIFCTFYEYCGNNSVWELMYRHKVEENPLPYRDIKHYATMVAKALAYLHENNTPHRDIKSCNVFLDGDEEPFQVVKLGDVCSSLALNIQWPIMYTSTFPYTPPEVLEDSARLQNNEDAFKVDIWQFGMLLVELETLGMPFEGMSEDDTQNSILSGRLPPSLPPSSPFLPLIQQCLRVDPQERLSADLIVQHLSKLSV